MDLQKIKKIYFLGIKGVGMTMLAQYFKESGFEVIGSDTAEVFMTDAVLKEHGITFFEFFSQDNITKDIDLAVYSSAYNPEINEELKYLLSSNIKTITFAEALGGIFNLKYGIAVCGSHGKTTTSAWLGYVLSRAGMDPSVLVGAQVPQFDGNILAGKSNYMIAETDEYQNKLKFFEPKAVLLNNIDYDHPDFFKNEEVYKQVFIDFISKIPKKGFLVANFDDKTIASIANVNCRGRVISYSIENPEAVFHAENIRFENGKQLFNVFMEADNLGEFSTSLIGRHNIYNALAVIATCVELNIDLFEIRQALGDFSGTARRMQSLGKYNGAEIIDDYAHHPTEIKTTLAGIKEKYKSKNIICLFHPHTFTRTKALLSQFGASFEATDELVILDIYGSAREEKGGVSSLDLLNKIKEHNEKEGIIQKTSHIASLSDAEGYLRKKIGRGDLLVLMGAGDVFRVGENLVGR